MINFFTSFNFFLIIIASTSIVLGHYITQKIKLFDFPSSKKVHKHPVPLSGGISFVIVFNIVTILLLNQETEYTYSLITILISLNTIFVIGLLDDYINLNYRIRVLASILVYLFFINSPTLNSVITIKNFFIEYIFFENYQTILRFNFLHGTMFTIFCLLFFQFSTNMLDGINGLCTMYLFFLNFLLITFPATILIIYQLNLLLLVFTFLYFFLNIKGKSFLGDSGVYSLSFLTAIIILTHYKLHDIDFLDIIIMTLIPSIDLLRLSIRRIIAKKSPFYGDKNHLHHRILDKIDITKTLLVYVFFFTSTYIFIYFNSKMKIIFILSISIIYFIIVYKTKNLTKVIK